VRTLPSLYAHYVVRSCTQMDSSGADALGGPQLGPATAEHLTSRLRGSRSAREGITSELAICSVMPRASTAGSVISRPRKVGCLGAQPLVLNTNLDERLLAVSRAHAGCGAPDGWLTAAGNSPGRSNGIRIHRIG
jgi:hypothetical protein